MAVHHLNCGSMCPHGGRLVSGEGGLTGARIVCHCLLVETANSLVLVDTGMGLERPALHPNRRLGAPFNLAFRPRADPAETAIERIRALGFDPTDVRHIALTHLDLDHAGGLPDFPGALVHVTAPEHAAAIDPSLRDRTRYPACHFDHSPRWRIHGAGGDSWFGFESIRVLPESTPRSC